MGDTNRTVNILIKAKNEASAALEGVFSGLGTITGAAAAAAGAVGAFAAIVTKLTQAAMEQENADTRLAIALASVGQNTAATREHLNSFIAQLEHVTGVSDESISSAAALLAQLGQLTGQGLEDATRAALDLSAALGMDLQSAAQLVAKAAEGNTVALGRYGIVIDHTLPKNQQFAETLRLIKDRFGGTAEAVGGTFSSALQRVANDFDNLEQALGEAIVKNEAFRDLLSSLSSFLKNLEDLVKRNHVALEKLAAVLADTVTVVIHAVVKFAEFVAWLDKLDAPLTHLEEWLGLVQKGTEEAGAAIRNDFVTALQGLERSLRAIEGHGKSVSDMLVVMHEKTEFAGDALDRIGNSGKPIKEAAEAVKAFKEAIGPVAPGLIGLEAILDTLGMETMTALADRQRVFNALVDELAEKFQGEDGLPEEFRSIFESAVGIAEALPDWSVNLSAAAGHVREIHDRLAEVGDEIDGAVVGAALNFSDALIDGAFGAKIAWGQFFKQMLADLLKAIVRAFVLKYIFESFTFGIGSKTSTAATGATGAPPIFPGRESIVGMFAPAQGILPSAGASAGAVLSAVGIRNTEPGNGPSQGGALQMFNQIVPRRDRESEIADLVTEISRSVERRGYHLVASRLVS